MEAENTEEDELVEIPKPPDFPKHRRKVSPIDTSHLRRSVRLEKLSKGFKSGTTSTPTEPSPAKTTSASTKKRATVNLQNSERALVVYEGHSVPNASPSPHLSLENAQAIGAGFCKMPPSAVSEKELLQEHKVIND